jgi:hypothetical protein
MTGYFLTHAYEYDAPAYACDAVNAQMRRVYVTHDKPCKQLKFTNTFAAAQ